MSGKNAGSSGHGTPESDADDNVGEVRGQDRDGGGHARRRLEEMISQRMPVESTVGDEQQDKSGLEDASPSVEQDSKEEAPDEE